MNNSDQNPQNIIAPCGMNCALCSRYLALKTNLKKSHCAGCRAKNEICNYLFAKCSGINHNQKINPSTKFCHECDQFPCKQLKRMDKRYKTNYGMSVIENLERMKEIGMTEFIQEQSTRHACPQCEGLISIHNKKCFNCDTITKLVEK